MIFVARNPEEVAAIAYHVCAELFSRIPTKEEVSLLVGTAAVESSFRDRIQKGGGPARGLWQVEPETAASIFHNYLRYRIRSRRRKKALWERFMWVWLRLENIPYFEPSKAELGFHLQHNDRFCCALARLKYLPVPWAIPSDLPGQAAYWKEEYNTATGAGHIQQYLAAWEGLDCAKLVDRLAVSEVNSFEQVDSFGESDAR